MPYKACRDLGVCQLKKGCGAHKRVGRKRHAHRFQPGCSVWDDATDGVWTCQVNQLDVEGGSDGEDAIVAVEFAEDHPTNPGVGNLLEAVPARTGGDVDGAAVNHDAVARGLQDGVASAWMVATQWPFSIMCPASLQ